MKQLILILSFTFGLTTAANAEMFPNREAWIKHSDQFQQTYLMGLYDGIMTIGHEEPGYEEIWKDKVEDCMIEMDANSKTLKDMVDNFYSDVGNWTTSVVEALGKSLHKACVKD